MTGLSVMAKRLYVVINIDKFSEKNIIENLFFHKNPQDFLSGISLFEKFKDAQLKCSSLDSDDVKNKKKQAILEIDVATTSKQRVVVSTAPDSIINISKFINPETNAEIIPAPKFRKLQILLDRIEAQNSLSDVIKNIKPAELPMLLKYLKEQYSIDDNALTKATRDLTTAYIDQQKASIPEGLKIALGIFLGIATGGIGFIAWGAYELYKHFSPDYFQRRSFDLEAVWYGQRAFINQFKPTSKKHDHIQSYTEYVNYLNNNQNIFHLKSDKTVELRKTIEANSGQYTTVTGSRFQIQRWKEWEKLGKTLREQSQVDSSDPKLYDKVREKYNQSHTESDQILQEYSTPIALKK